MKACFQQAREPSLANVKLGKGSLTALLESHPPALCLRPAAGQAYMSVQYAADAEDAVLVWWWWRGAAPLSATAAAAHLQRG